jgi:lysophospholipid acyltransferase (LPLAT)-like uncharacterized protein
VIEVRGVNYASPKRFTLTQRFVLAVAPPLMAGAIKTLYSLCSKNVVRSDNGMAAERHCIIAIWHETMHLAACRFSNAGYHTLASYSFDGELGTHILRRFGILSVRGSSSRGGSEALQGLELALEHGPVGWTLDGPKGPRRVAKPGVAILAARAKTPVLPLAMYPSPCWRLHSWDRLPVPKPFCRISIAYGDPIPPPPDATPEAIEQMRARIERELNALHEMIEG